MRSPIGPSLLIILAGSATLRAQSGAPTAGGSELDGRWTGSAVIYQITPDDIREDSAGFEFSLATSDSGTKGDLVLTTGSNRQLTGLLLLEARGSGTVTLASDVDGAHVVFTGATTDSTMAGSFTATANGENVGTGNWSVSRAP